MSQRRSEENIMSHWPKIRPTIDEMVNRQFDTAEFKKLFAVRLTPRRIEVYQNHMTFYANNRRDCWSFVAGKAPARRQAGDLGA